MRVFKIVLILPSLYLLRLAPFLLRWSWADAISTFLLAAMSSNTHVIIMYCVVLFALCAALTLLAFYIDRVVQSVRGYYRRVMVMFIISFCTIVALFWTFSLAGIIQLLSAQWLKVILMWIFFFILLGGASILIMVGRYLIRWSAHSNKSNFSKIELGCRVAFQERMLEVTCGFTLGSWGSYTWAAMLEPLRANSQSRGMYFLMTT